MNLQYVDSALHIRKLNRHTSVETTRSKKCRIKAVRLVRRRKHYNALGSVKAVHLGKQLIKRLLTLIIAAESVAASLLAYRIYLVYENDAGCLLLCLLEEVSYLGCSHADEHLYKFGAGNAEEGNICLTCDCLGEHGLTCSGRAYKQCALRNLGSYLVIFLRLVQEINHLGKKLLGLILTCHILELDAYIGILIDLGIGFAEAAHAHESAASLLHCLHHIVA